MQYQKHTKTIFTICLAALAHESGAVPSGYGHDRNDPNIVIILVDQYRADAIGCLGREPVATPNLDKLIAQGVYCPNATSPHPLSSPARAVLMTGLYPLNNGVTGNCTSRTREYGVELKEDARCWSDILKANGYALGYLGKWHLDSPREPFIPSSNNKPELAWNEWCPPERRHGFSYWVAYGTYDKHLHPIYWYADATRDQWQYVNQWSPEFEADRAIEYIDNKHAERENDKPFALVVSMNPPHPGYGEVPDKYQALYAEMDVETIASGFPNLGNAESRGGKLFRHNIRNYYAAITGVDEQIGRIVDHIDNRGLGENTIIVFVADHGNGLGLNGVEQKGSFLDVSFRIPLIIRYTGTLRPATRTTPIDLADLYPTIFGLMGRQAWIPKEIDGEDLSAPLISDNASKPYSRPYLVYQFDQPVGQGTGGRGIRTEQYTFALRIRDGDIVNGYFYDNLQDPWQLKNQYEGMSSRLRQEMIGELRKTLEKIGDPFGGQL